MDSQDDTERPEREDHTTDAYERRGLAVNLEDYDPTQEDVEEAVATLAAYALRNGEEISGPFFPPEGVEEDRPHMFVVAPIEHVPAHVASAVDDVSTRLALSGARN